MKIKIKLVAIFFFVFQPAIAADLPKEIPQGSLVVGQSLDADEIIVDNNSLKVSEKGHFVFAVGRDHVEPISVTYLKNGSLIKIHQNSWLYPIKCCIITFPTFTSPNNPCVSCCSTTTFWYSFAISP